MSIKIVFVLVAVLCALAVLFGAHLDQAKVLAVGVLSAALAVVVP